MAKRKITKGQTGIMFCVRYTLHLIHKNNSYIYNTQHFVLIC